MSIQQLSVQAHLAQASFPVLSAGMPELSLRNALQPLVDGITPTQAQQFAGRHSVVLQYNDDASLLIGNGMGLSLTGFRDNSSNSTVPAEVLSVSAGRRGRIEA